MLLQINKLRTSIALLLMVLSLICTSFTANAASATDKVTSVDIRLDGKSPTAINISVGKSTGLTVRYGLRSTVSSSEKSIIAGSIRWKSSNKSVASVSKGIVRGVKAGRAKITVELNGKTDSVTVVVKSTPAKWIGTGAAYTALNKYRKKAKLSALKKNNNLEKIAKIRAKEMAVYGKFSHTRPNGKSALTLIKGSGYKGENIARGQKSCVAVSEAWYKSPGHRANMLHKKYRKAGIACYRYKGVNYWVQVFSS